MKKKGMFAAIAAMAVGFAAVSTTLYINGTANIIKNSDDFRVYYSNAYVNGGKDLSVIKSDTEIVFTTSLDEIGEKYVLVYDVSNASKNYDAALKMNCTSGNDYLKVTNVFDVSTNLEAATTRSGKLTLELLKSNTGDDKNISIVCTLDADGVERNTLADDLVVDNVCYGEVTLISGDGTNPGDVIALCDEQFYVVEFGDEDVTLMSVLNVDYEENKQKVNALETKFSQVTGSYDYSLVKGYVENYGDYLTSIGFNNEISIVDRTIMEDLGCVIDYNMYSLECPVELPGWLTERNYWTSFQFAGSLSIAMSNGNWIISSSKSGVRPVVKISRNDLNIYK